MNRTILAVATLLLVAVTSGCVSTPMRSRDRIGDFVSDIAMAAPASGTHRS